MEIFEINVNDDETMAQLLELACAVHASDFPESTPPSAVRLAANYRHTLPGADHRYRVARVDGRIVGKLDVELPNLDNFHLASIGVEVHPDHRRRGIGRALLQAGLDIAREDNRRTVTSRTHAQWEDGPARPEAGQRFLEAMGFALALTQVQRQTDLAAFDPAVEQELYDDTLAKSLDYETIAWQTPSPGELLEGRAHLDSIFVEERPMGDLDMEAQKVTGDRMRAKEEGALERGILFAGVTARHIPTGEIVADTTIGVYIEPGDRAAVWGTLVAPGHRGHRLGMRIKIENHRWLRKHLPKVRWVATGNADDNIHMTAINDALGFHIHHAELEYQRSI